MSVIIPKRREVTLPCFYWRTLAAEYYNLFRRRTTISSGGVLRFLPAAYNDLFRRSTTISSGGVLLFLSAAAYYEFFRPRTTPLAEHNDSFVGAFWALAGRYTDSSSSDDDGALGALPTHGAFALLS